MGITVAPKQSAIPNINTNKPQPELDSCELVLFLFSFNCALVEVSLSLFATFDGDFGAR